MDFKIYCKKEKWDIPHEYCYLIRSENRKNFLLEVAEFFKEICDGFDETLLDFEIIRGSVSKTVEEVNFTYEGKKIYPKYPGGFPLQFSRKFGSPRRIGIAGLYSEYGSFEVFYSNLVDFYSFDSLQEVQTYLIEDGGDIALAERIFNDTKKYEAILKSKESKINSLFCFAKDNIDPESEYAYEFTDFENDGMQGKLDSMQFKASRYNKDVKSELIKLKVVDVRYDEEEEETIYYYSIYYDNLKVYQLNDDGEVSPFLTNGRHSNID